MGRKLTIAFIVVAVTLIAAYDVMAVSLWGLDATISHVITDASHKYLAIPVAFGFLMGHFFG